MLPPGGTVAPTPIRPYKSEPSLRGGGWCDNLLSGASVNEERKKQDKIRLFTLNS